MGGCLVVFFFLPFLFYFFFSLKTLLVVAICKPETGTFTEHYAIGKDANWVAKFLKPISRQTLCSLFSTVDCMSWNLPEQEETATSCGSSRCLFFVHLPCCASSVSVCITAEPPLMENMILLRCRGGGEAPSPLIHLFYLLEGRAGCTCCPKGYCWLKTSAAREQKGSRATAGLKDGPQRTSLALLFHEIGI